MPEKKKGKSDEFDINIGKKITSLRKLNGYSQSTLAGMLNVTFQQIQKYETGKNRISASKLMRLCNVMKVSPTYFTDTEVSEAEDIIASIGKNVNLIELMREARGLETHKLQALVRFVKVMN